MASNFPSSLDSFTNPSSSDAMDSVSVPHATQHSDLNDAVEALQAKVGADSSAVTSSLDYKVAQLEAISHGKILQVVSTTKTDSFTTTSTSFVDVTGLSVSITPTSATSTILVIYSIALARGANNTGKTAMQVVRDSTALFLTAGGHTAQISFQSALEGPDYASGASVDSPATTSATTYKIQLKTNSGTGAVNAVYDGTTCVSSLTVMEVSA